MSRHETLVTKPRYSRSPSPIRSGLIDWTLVEPGLWSGQIGLDFAGLVELTGESFTVSDWKGDHIDTFGSLLEAQLSLEPAHRAELRDRAERSSVRANLLVTGAVLVLAISVASVVGAWLTTMV